MATRSRRKASTDSHETGGSQAELRELLTFKVGQFLTWYNRSLAVVYAERFGVTINEWRTLFLVHLHDVEGLSLGRLAELAVLDPGLMSRIIAALVERELIARERVGRAVRITLTGPGNALVRRIVREAQARNARLMRRLTALERRTLAAAMDKLLEEAKYMAEEASRQFR